MNSRKICSIVSAFLVAASVFAYGPRRMNFTVAGYKGTEVLADFPVLVRISEATIPGFHYADCSPDGNDLAFYSLPDKTELPREIEKWDPSGESLVWVRLPELRNGLTFRCHFGDKGAARPPCQDDGSVWSAGYAAVWHFSEPDGVAFDSTTNHLDAVPQGDTAKSIAVQGVVGTGRQNPSSGNNESRLLVPSYDNLTLKGSFTVSGWFRAGGGGAWMRVLSRKDIWSEHGGWEFELAAGNGQSFWIYGSGSGGIHGDFPTSLRTDWQNIVLVYDGNQVSVYANGKLLSSGKITEATDNGKSLGLGGTADGGSSHFPGYFDEMRLRDGIASADRIRADYDTMFEADFLSVGQGVEGEPDVSTLVVSSEPYVPLHGDQATPSYGMLEGLEAGEPVDCSLLSRIFFPEEGVCAVCTGWRLYAYDMTSGDYLFAEDLENSSGTGTAFQYSHPSPAKATKLAWQFAVSNLVTATANNASLGSVDKPKSWILQGGSIVLQAHPAGGSVFVRWRGDVPEGANPKSPAISLTVDRPLVLFADFAPVDSASNLYVSPNGKDSNDGLTWETALANPQTAVDLANEGDVIHVDDGTYGFGPTSRDEAVLTIGKNVSLVSRNGPEKTILDGGVNDRVDRRALTILGVASNTVFSGFGIQNGSQDNYYKPSSIKADGGVISNCFVRCRHQSRAAFVELTGDAVMRDSVIDALGSSCGNSDGRNAAVRVLGHSLLENCVVRNMRYGYRNYAVRLDDEMISGATVRGCVISNNLVGNAAAGKGEGAVYLYNGILENCTIVGNESYGKGAGVYVEPRSDRMENVVCRNNIIWNNKAALGFNDIYGTEKSGYGAGVATNCCASDLPYGVRGNINLDPTFKDYARGDLRLDPASPCVDTAEKLPWMEGALDISGNKRIFGAGPDMGAYESQEKVEGIVASINAKTTSGRVPLEVEFISTAVGDIAGADYAWDFGDGTTGTGPNPVHTYTDPGAYDVGLTVVNGAEDRCSVTKEGYILVVPQTCYVSTNGLHQSPFATWETAATNVMEALALNSAEVVVSNGTYIVDPGGVSPQKDVVLRSVNGPLVTTLDTGLTTTHESRRLVALKQEGAVVSGFTLRHGCAGDYYYHSSILASAGTVTNCIVKDNIYISRCAIVYLEGSAKLLNCTVGGTKENWNTDNINNGAISMRDNALVQNCIITNFVLTINSSATTPSAGVILRGKSVLRNSLVIGTDIGVTKNYEDGAVNTKGVGAGVAVMDGTPTVENCTIVSNTVATTGGGIHVASGVKAGALIRNNIVWGNQARGPEQDVFINPAAGAVDFVANCTPVVPVETAVDTVTASPRFRSGAWTLGYRSPCINAGKLADWMTDATDLAGNPRVRNRLPDIGCYEGLLPGGTMLMLR